MVMDYLGNSLSEMLNLCGRNLVWRWLLW